MLEHELIKELLKKRLTMAEQRGAVQFLSPAGCRYVVTVLWFIPIAHVLLQCALTQRQRLDNPDPGPGCTAPALWLSTDQRPYQSEGACQPETHSSFVAAASTSDTPSGTQVHTTAAPKVAPAAYPGHIWAIDLGEDTLTDGNVLRILTVLDEFTREGVSIDVALTTSAERVIGVLSTLLTAHAGVSYSTVRQL